MTTCKKEDPFIGLSHCYVCSRKYAESLAKSIMALHEQVKALTEERDAQAEAVKRMGAWLRLWRLFKGRPRSEVDAPGTPYRAFRDAERGVWNNPIARAAVERGAEG